MQYPARMAVCACFSLALRLFPMESAVAGQVKQDKADDYSFQRNLAEGAAFLAQGTKSSLARALGRFKIALKQRPESAKAYYWIALTYSDLQNHDLAAKHAEEATLCDHKMAQAWLLWGQSLMFLGKWKLAKQKLDKAEQLSEDDPLVSFNLARCYYHGFGNTNDALYLFKETISRIGERRTTRQYAGLYLQAKLYVGTCCLAKDMTLAAVSAFKDVLRIDRNNAQAWFRLGMALRMSDRIAGAERALTYAIRLNNTDYAAMLQLGHLYVVDRPNKRLARYYLTLFLKYAPRDHAWRKRAKEYLEQQETKSTPRKQEP